MRPHQKGTATRNTKGAYCTAHPSVSVKQAPVNKQNVIRCLTHCCWIRCWIKWSVLCRLQQTIPILMSAYTTTVPAGSPSCGGGCCCLCLCPFFLILFFCLFPSSWPFQLYFVPQILPTTLRFLTLFFRSYFLQLCIFTKVSLNCLRDPARLPCAATRVGEEATWRLRFPLAAVCWGQHISLARTSLGRVFGLARPNRSAGRAEP